MSWWLRALLILLCTAGCKSSVVDAADAAPIPSSTTPPAAGVSAIRFTSDCRGCACCDSGAFVSGEGSPSFACAECVLTNNLTAHGLGFEGSDRFQVGTAESGPFLRLTTRQTVRLRLAPETTLFGLKTRAGLPRVDCELRLTTHPGTPRAQTARFAVMARKATNVSVGSADGAPLGTLELDLDCRSRGTELAIGELWYLPSRPVRWPALVDQPRLEVQQLPQATKVEPGRLTWEPPVALVRSPSGNAAELAVAVLGAPVVQQALGLSKELDVFELEQTRGSRVTLKRRFTWNGRQVPVSQASVTLLLLDGDRLRSIEHRLGPAILIPKRQPLSASAASAILKSKGEAPRGLETALELVIHDGRLSYRAPQTCRDRLVDAFTGALSSGPMTCIQ